MVCFGFWLKLSILRSATSGNAAAFASRVALLQSREVSHENTCSALAVRVSTGDHDFFPIALISELTGPFSKSSVIFVFVFKSLFSF